MKDVLLFLFVMSMPFSWFAGSWLPFIVCATPGILVFYFVVVGNLNRNSLREVFGKMRRMHVRMDAVAKHARRLSSRRHGWQAALDQALTTLDEPAIHVLVSKVLRAEGYRPVTDRPIDSADSDTFLMRKESKHVVVKLIPKPEKVTSQSEIYDFVRNMDDVKADKGLEITLGPISRQARKLAERNQIQVINRPELAKRLVANRKRIRQRKRRTDETRESNATLDLVSLN
ncbi:MAG: hypothetical protein CMO80_17070 [Verrucomicrobiales bacterium]|nr:hypothetical protein [Verrucomicrobiales bacterium]